MNDVYDMPVKRISIVEVFKTNVHKTADAKMLIEQISELFPACDVNFDLEDCDRILRIAGADVDTEIILSLLQALNFDCVAL